jgi:hypothetical protein
MSEFISSELVTSEFISSELVASDDYAVDIVSDVHGRTNRWIL